MKLTPIEIEKQQFTKTFRGYDPLEVHAFLNHVAHQMSLSLNQLQDLREKNLIVGR